MHNCTVTVYHASYPFTTAIGTCHKLEVAQLLILLYSGAAINVTPQPATTSRAYRGTTVLVNVPHSAAYSLAAN